MRIPIILAILGLAAGASGQRDFSQVNITTTHVAGNVYLLEGAGGNIAVSVGEDGILMVDAQFAQLAPRIEAALAQISKGDLKFLLNTHYHGDHTGGNPAFGDRAPIIAHHNVRRRLADKAPEGWPVITFEEGLSIHFNGEEIVARHYPAAHTDGDVVVHIGDLFFSGRFPYVDRAGGGDVAGYMGALKRMAYELPPDVLIVSGHSAIMTPDSLRRYHSALTEQVAFIRAGMDRGRSLKQLLKQGLPAKWQGWGWNLVPEEKWIEAVFRSEGG